jgi:hypothetical protein
LANLSVLDLLNEMPEISGLALDPVLAEAMTPPDGDIVQELRSAHHLLAKTLAEGVEPQAAAARCGMTMARVRKLQDDPTFRELLEYYKGQQEELFAHVKDRLAALGMTFVDVLQERVLDKPEKFTNRELMDFAKEFLERTIAPSKAAAAGGGGHAGVQIAINFVKPSEGPAGTLKELDLQVIPHDPLKGLT